MALVDQCIASYAEPPAAIVLDLDHSDDPTYGPQEFAFSNHHYQNHCSLRSSFSKGRRMPWSLPSYVRAPARLGPKMPGSWSGCCRISGATGLTPLFWSAAIVILLPRR